MKHIHWIFLPLLGWSCSGLAAPPLPTAGGLLPPANTQPPSSTVRPLEIRQPQVPVAAPSTATDNLKLVVKSLQLTGAQVFAPAYLVGISGFSAGKAYTLTEVRAMAASIERYYRGHGYPAARAHVPAQDINDGAITIAVAEGHYSQVLVRNQSHVSAGVLSDLLQEIKTGDLVVTESLESKLLLLSDLPGVQIKSALVPGATFGSSDLMVDVLPGRRVAGSIDADNAGNYYTGTSRVGATLVLNEPSGEGDVASARLLTSGQGLNYFRAAYQLQVGPTRVGAAYSHLDYKLGREFESLLANGTAQSLGFFGSYPLLRSRTNNLYLGVSYESKQFEDRQDAVSTVTEKAAHVFTASFTGDKRDQLGAGGLSTFALILSSGELAIQTAPARVFDAATVQSNGHFNKLGFNASRQQYLTPSLMLYAGINGQLASKNLDTSEKMALGGMSAVRAYPEGEGYGDEGYVLNLEARWLLPPWSPRATGQLQLVGFVDTGSVTINKKPWSSSENQRTLSGVGLGLNWSTADRFQVRLAYAHKLGHEAAHAAPDANDRLWLQGIKYF